MKNQLIDVEITSLSKRGNGVGKYINEKGIVNNAEVPFAVPGDVVRAKVRKWQGGTYQAVIDNVLTQGPGRVRARCPHFAICGGCRWQQLNYSDQLAAKESAVKACFASILTPDVDFRPAIPCESIWEYRNKMEFSFSQDAAGQRFLGLVMDSTKGRVLDLKECHLVNPWHMDALKAVREWWRESGLEAFRPMSNTGALRTLTLREGLRTGDRMVMLTVSGNPEYALQKPQIEAFVASLRAAVEPKHPDAFFSVFLRIQQVAKGMSTNFYEMLLYGSDHIREVLHVTADPEDGPRELHFRISPTVFFQPNTAQAEKLYSTALQMVGIAKGAVVYDLYCGTGTLGICAATRAGQVIGIEVSSESSLDARTNASLNHLENVTVISGAVRHVLPQIINEKTYPMPDVVMVDPPRPGLDKEAMQGLIDINAPRILYVSCNPETQAYDVSLLMNHGYRIVAIQPIDQFAQTAHIENIVVLEKKS